MQQEQVLFSLPLERMEPIFKRWISEVIETHSLGNFDESASLMGNNHLNIKQASEFLGVADQTIYQNIKKIPHSKRFGKLYFLRSELEQYLAEGKVGTKK